MEIDWSDSNKRWADEVEKETVRKDLKNYEEEKDRYLLL